MISCFHLTNQRLFMYWRNRSFEWFACSFFILGQRRSIFITIYVRKQHRNKNQLLWFMIDRLRNYITHQDAAQDALAPDEMKAWTNDWGEHNEQYIDVSSKQIKYTSAFIISISSTSHYVISCQIPDTSSLSLSFVLIQSTSWDPFSTLAAYFVLNIEADLIAGHCHSFGHKCGPPMGALDAQPTGNENWQ